MDVCGGMWLLLCQEGGVCEGGVQDVCCGSVCHYYCRCRYERERQTASHYCSRIALGQQVVRMIINSVGDE